MAKNIEEKRKNKAQSFIKGAKDEFKKFIPRDKIGDVDIRECVEKDGGFDITGSVATTSPTGKLKTFGYSAFVEVDGEGAKCSLSKLQVREI